MLAVSSKVIIEGRRSGDLTARLSHFLYGLVPHYFRQIIYSRSLVFYSRRYGRSECISPICTKKKEMKETIISIPLLSSPTSRTAESPVLTSYVAVRDNVRKSFFFLFRIDRFAATMLMNLQAAIARVRVTITSAHDVKAKEDRGICYERGEVDFVFSAVRERAQRF